MNTPETEILAALHLGPALDIYGGDSIRRAMLEHLSTSPGLSLDLSGVETCDAAGIQLLCSARRSALEAGKPFRLEQIPLAVTDCCARLGLAVEWLNASNT